MGRRQGPRQYYSKPPTYIWRPCIPIWEKEFTLKVGNFTWKNFVEAKKYTKYDDKIMTWNDSASEEAFNLAKQRFYNQYHNKSCDQIMYDPDMYIDKIVDSEPESRETNVEDEDPMLSISDMEEEILKHERMNETNAMVPLREVEEIIPTGWDFPETTNVLTGMIVGEDDVEEKVLGDSTNVGEKLPALRSFEELCEVFVC